MGDDTWLTVFPTAFHPEMSHDFDSFNVEDLHTVDNGVIANLFPLLTNSTHAHSWDFLIGHFLGVDHVGHRVGPDHPTMLGKQQQMNDVLKRVVDLLDDDTLLVVLGDHGMDRKGDHGGDGDLEVSTGLWIYSKGPALSSENPPTSGLPHKTFPGESTPHRSVQQIDLVPTLSLLLGLPIPFNNLGTVIPELFWRDRSGSNYAKALDINARQVHEYLDTYRNSPSGGELDGMWRTLEASWARFHGGRPEERPEAGVYYNRLALETCRSLWARFNPMLMMGGLGVIVLSLIVGWGTYERSRSIGEWGLWTASLGRVMALSASAGAALAAVAYALAKGFELLDGITLYQAILFGASVSSGVRVLISAPPKLRISWTTPILLLHSISFLSNSYLFWEDRVVPFFLPFTLVSPLLTAFSAPTARLRSRILTLAALFAGCVRLVAISTVCREEQHPWCSVTFFSGSGAAEPPVLVRVLLLPAAVLVPYGIRRVLAISKSDNGIASLVLPYILPPALITGSTCWLLEWLDSSGSYEYFTFMDLRRTRTILAWSSVLAVLVGTALWALVPVALQISSERKGAGASLKTEVRVLGFANAYGAPFAILWALFLVPVWLAAQPSAQISLALVTAALFAHLELIDAARDARAVHASLATDPAGALARLQQGMSTTEVAREREQGVVAVTLDEVVPLALLARLAFFASGHQATLSSIQWKSAFVLTRTVTYPLSPLLVILNTFGPTALIALATSLLGIWNLAPLEHTTITTTTTSSSSSSSSPHRGISNEAPKSQARVATLAAVRAALGMSQYFAALLLGSALSAALLRRHLMVWKVFAPRYMLGAVELVCVDVAVLVGLWLGVGRIVGRITRVFALPEAAPAAAPRASSSSRSEEKVPS
jgi:phosphatidylinositol glycan class O